MRFLSGSTIAFVCFLIGVVSMPISAQDSDDWIIGSWEGTLVAGPQELQVLYHVSRGADGALGGTMDVPAQGASGISLTMVTVDGTTVTMTFAVPGGGTYEGRLTAAGDSIQGTFSQGPGSFPMVLGRMAGAPEPPSRSQRLEPPFPYRVEDVIFAGPEAGIELAGTLTAPEGDGPFPGVVLVSGSGPQDRDETLLGHKPFLVLADHLTRNGIAVLRYDDRGVGRSTGDFSTATSMDFVADALAAVAFLRERPEVANDIVGIAGHSEGGLVAPLASNRSDDVAGPQMEAFMREQTNSVSDELREAVQGGLSDDAIRGAVRQFNSPWFRFFLHHDPRPPLESVRVPILALFGGKDLQVPPSLNIPEIERAFERGGNPDATVRMLPGLNHLFQEAETGSPAEYGQIEQTMSPILLETVSDWILERFGGS